MKRISILVTVVMATGAYGARSHTVPFSCRISYSPYAYEHGSSGLIPRCVHYSPYALGHGYSGLVPSTIRYNPYALVPGHSGLISELGCCCVSCATWTGLYVRDGCADRSAKAPCCEDREANQGPEGGWPRPAPGQRARAPVQTRVPAPDPKRAILAYLSQMRPGRFQVTRLVSMDNETVSFDVVLEDRNMVIKYWNGRKIQWIRRLGDHRLRAWTDYLVNWIAYRDEFEAAGGKVYHIASDNTYALLGELATCLRAKSG